jgi:hypothetical protein
MNGVDTTADSVPAPGLRLMCALVVKAPFERTILPAFAGSGGRFEIVWAPTTVIQDRLAQGELAEAVLLTVDAVDALVAAGNADPTTGGEVVQPQLGVAVAPGASRPVMSMVDSFRQALLDARSVAFSKGGASGIYFAGLIERQGITEAIRAKATIIPSGFTAEKLLTGEALTALDAKLRETLRVEIDSLLRQMGVTTIYVTHDQAEAMAVGDRIIAMDQGRVAQVGTPREIYHHPATRFVAEFIGMMNRVPGNMQNDVFVCPAGVVESPLLASDCREILFRPEHATLVDAGGNGLVAQIVSAVFLGDRTRLLLSGFGPQPVIVETSERRLYAAGEFVTVSIDPGALISM